MDIRRNADRLTLIYTATPFKIQFWVVYTQAYGGAAGVIAPEHAAAKRGHRPFFFWSEKKGGSSAPSEPPLATCLDIDSAWMAIFFGGFLSLLIVSLLLAISSRNVPSDFNDASSLLMSAATITSLWIILVPAYYVSTSVPSSNLLTLIITSQGMASFLFLFSRRLFYLVRPMSEEKMKARKMFARWSSAEQKHDKTGAAGGANSSSSSEVACQEPAGR